MVNETHYIQAYAHAKRHERSFMDLSDHFQVMVELREPSIQVLKLVCRKNRQKPRVMQERVNTKAADPEPASEPQGSSLEASMCRREFDGENSYVSAAETKLVEEKTS